MALICHARPHEVLKCLKRAQLFVEADDISNLRKLGDHCLTMGLFEEAAMYWTRAISSVTVGRTMYPVLTAYIMQYLIPFVSRCTSNRLREARWAMLCKM